jgi:3-oxocholest-4-en-26-oyl-CoA dehydrogenase beta subunit
VDFTESESQAELAALAREILAKQLTEQRLREAETGPDRFDPALWSDLAGSGVLSAALPEQLGGDGLGLLEQCSVLIELGRAVAPVPYLASVVLGAGAVARFGSQDQQRRWAEPAGRGELILTAALAEEDGGEPAAPSATAQPDGDGWLLSGVKTTVPAAPLAALMLVPAAVPGGVAVFGVAPSDEGVTVQRQELTGGEPAGRVRMDRVRLGSGRVLGSPADGVADWLQAVGTVGLCATAAGIAGRALELTAEYARSREQFGRPVGAFQAVAQRLADAFIDTEAIRLTMWQAAWRLSAGLPCAAEVATAKFWAADAGHRVAHTAVHVHGGVGIDLSYPLQRYFTAATHAEFALGGASAQLRRLGAALADGAALTGD